VLLAGAAGVAICLGALGLLHRSVARRVDEAIAVAAAAPDPGALGVEPITPPEPRAGVRLWTDTSDAADGAALEGRLVAATGGGLVELELGGRGDRPRVATAVSVAGLSDHDLTAAAPLEGPAALALGSRSGAIAVVEPGGARSARVDGGARGAVTDLAWFDGSLYVATASGALIRLSRDLRRAALVGPVVEGGLPALAAGPRGLIAAGGDGAVYRVEGDALARVAEPASGEGSRLTAVAWLGDRIVAGSPLALLAAREGGRLEPVRTDLFVTALLAHEDRLYLGTTDRGVLVIDGGYLAAEPLRQLLDGRWISRLRVVDGRPVAFGPDLVAWLDPDAAPEAAQGSDLQLPPGLSSNHVTALALDDQRRLWVGHFEDGVDVMSSDGEVVRHVPSPGPDEELARLSAVNALAFDPWAGAMLVGTSHGVLEVDDAAVDAFDERDGLIGDSVAAILVTDTGRVFATNQGLTVASRLGEMRSIYAFHGLPSNRLSALAGDGDGQIVVGSLGGLALVEASTLEVGRRLEAAPAGLRASWCAALAVAPEGIYVGTVGGGVDLWLSGGEVERIELPGAERITVNPGAMLVAGDRLLVGTVERGLLVLDRSRRAWVEVEQPLPGASVAALAADGDVLYLGTDRGLLRLDPGGLEG
jgi:hypothetical protein